MRSLEESDISRCMHLLIKHVPEGHEDWPEADHLVRKFNDSHPWPSGEVKPYSELPSIIDGELSSLSEALQKELNSLRIKSTDNRLAMQQSIEEDNRLDKQLSITIRLRDLALELEGLEVEPEAKSDAELSAGSDEPTAP